MLDANRVYTLKERSDISDMFAAYSQRHWGPERPFGVGHDRSYFGYDFTIGKEAFAEMTSASIAQPESLAVIKQFFPKSFQMYCDMIRSVLT